MAPHILPDVFQDHSRDRYFRIGTGSVVLGTSCGTYELLRRRGEFKSVAAYGGFVHHTGDSQGENRNAN